LRAEMVIVDVVDVPGFTVAGEEIEI